MQAGEIQIKLTLDNGQFTVETKKAGETIQELKKSLDATAQSTQSLDRHFSSLYMKFHDTVRTASLLRFAIQDINDLFLTLPTAIVKTAAEFERMNVLMEGMATTAQASGRAMEAMTGKNYIIKMALETPFDLKALTDSFVKFKSAGIDPTDGSMKGLVESVAKFGGTSETLHRASIAVQQMAGKGVISMEELRQQLGEAVPTAMATMARGAGVSMAELSNKVKQGTVEANGALKTMFTAMQIENFGAAQKMMDTWDGMMSQLKTKFTLWQLDVANQGFFDEMKKQLQDVIDVLGSPQAKQFAADFARDLTTIVKGFREIIDWTLKWKDELGMVATALFGMFVANKISNAAGSSGVVRAFQESADAAVLAAKKEADAVNLKRRDNEKLLADYQKSYEQELINARAAQDARVALYADEIAASQAHVEALRVQQQTELNNARNFNNQKNALQAQAGGLDLRTDANRYRARELMAEAEAARMASEAASAHAAAIAGEINKTIDSVAALEKKRAALAANVVAGNEHTAIIRQTIGNLQENITVLNNQAKAITDVTLGTKALHGMMGAGKVVWDAFGGWVGIAIGVLTVLGEKLYDYMNRWEKFRQIVEDTKRGIASEESQKQAKNRIDELDKEIEKKKRELRDMRGADSVPIYDYTSGARVEVGQKKRSDVQADLDNLLGQRRLAQDNYNEQTRLIEENASSIRVQQEERIIKRELAKVFDTWNEENKNLEKRKLDALDEARAGGKKLTDVQRKALEKPFNDQMVANEKSATQAALALVDKMIEDTNKTLAKADVVKETREQLTARLKALNDDKTGLRKELARLAKDAEDNLGKGLRETAKEQPDKPEDPLVRYVAGLEAQVAQAKLRLKANVNEVRDAVSLRNEAVVAVLGEVAKGAFDKPLGKDENNVARRQYMADREARKGLISEFTKGLEEGKGDADAFINSLKGVDDAQKALIRSAIDYKAQLPMLAEQIKALDDVQKRNAQSEEALASAREGFVNEGLVKESTEMLALQKHLAQLEERFKGATKEYAEFLKLRNSSLANQAMRDAEIFGTDAKKALREQELATIKATATVAEAREAEHQQNLQRIAREEQVLLASLQRQMQAENLDANKKKELEAEVEQVKKSAASKRQAEDLRDSRERMTALDTLRKQWGDAVQNMNQMSANWANTFMDNLVNVITGTKVDWKNMVSSMAKDLLGVILKKQLGDMVTGAFSSMSSSIGSALGFGSAAGAAGQATASTATTTAMTTMSTATTTAMTAMTTELTTALTGQSTAIGELVLSGTAAFGEMVTVVTTGMGEMVAAASASGGSAALFADGGIMTGRGPVPLNMYANGGVANSPQLAMFGEGSTPEAYVPLPDGRSIPVNIKGGNTTTNNAGGVVINIAVTNAGESQKSNGDEASTWNAMARRVKGVVMEELVNQQRPGGVLYK